MAGTSNPKTLNKTLLLSQSLSLPSALADDDDFQDTSPSQLRLPIPTSTIPSRKPLSPYNNNTASASRSSKKPKQHPLHGGKENLSVVGKCAEGTDSGNKLDNSRPTKKPKQQPLISEKSKSVFEDLDLCHGLESIESTIDCCSRTQRTENEEELKKGYLFKSIEARLLNSNNGLEERKEELEECSELDLLLKLCGEEEDEGDGVECFGVGDEYGLICCPLCGADISDLSGDMREVHTNECLDNEETPAHVVTANNDVSFQCPGQVLNDSPCQSPKKVVHVSPVVEWLRNLGLAKYEEIFVQEEIDWNALKSLTEEVAFFALESVLVPVRVITSSFLHQKRKKDYNNNNYPV